MSATAHTSAVHCSVSLRRHIERHRDSETRLRASDVAVWQHLWNLQPDPWASQPTVRASYESIAAGTTLGSRAVQEATERLARAGMLRKGGSVKGLGTAYTLLRPDHEPSDVELDPYTRPVASTVAGEAAELLRASGQTMKPKRHPKPAREQAPAIRPDRIAALLEDVAGIEPRYHEKGKRKGERRPVIPYSDKTGDPSAVRAAQRYIAAHGWDHFVSVCKAAVGRHDLTGSTQQERLHSFERADTLRMIEGLLTKPQAQHAASEPEPEPAREPEPEAQAAPANIVITDEMRAQYKGFSDEVIRSYLEWT